jgi:hypothetical protein
MFRAIIAMPFLLMAYANLMLAYWVCPGLKDKKGPPPAGAWVDAPEGWEKGQN